MTLLLSVAFIAGLIGTGGAIRSAFLTSFKTKKKTYIATMATVAIAFDLSRIPVYLQEGFLRTSYYWYIPMLVVVAFFGSFVGRYASEIDG